MKIAEKTNLKRQVLQLQSYTARKAPFQILKSDRLTSLNRLPLRRRIERKKKYKKTLPHAREEDGAA
jgi:hypothetical protein